jgi:hypothetical protein
VTQGNPSPRADRDSIIGMIQMPTSALYLVVELAGPIVVLAESFAAVVTTLASGELGARFDVRGRRMDDWPEAGHP